MVARALVKCILSCLTDEGYVVDYLRVPVTDEKAPKPEDFGVLIQRCDPLIHLVRRPMRLKLLALSHSSAPHSNFRLWWAVGDLIT